MDKDIKRVYRLAFRGYNLRSQDERKFRSIEVEIPKNHPSTIEGDLDEGWNEVALFDTLTREDRIEEEKRQQRHQEIILLYTMILKHGWYISNFHDKFHSGYMCFLIRDSGVKRNIIRLPL